MICPTYLLLLYICDIWMQKLNTIRNQNVHTYSVTEEEFNFIKSIKDWLLRAN